MILHGCAGRVNTGPMAPSAIERFTAACAEVGFEPAAATRYPDGTRTAADAAAAVGCDVGQIVKSLVFWADDAPLLALTSGANRVDVSKLQAAAAVAELRQANANEARDATGFAIGGTPPFGHKTQIRTLVDVDLLSWSEVYAAAGTPDSCFPLSPGDLLRVSGATEADFAERPAK